MPNPIKGRNTSGANTMRTTLCGVESITKTVSWWQVSRMSVRLGEPNGNNGTGTTPGIKCAAIKRYEILYLLLNSFRWWWLILLLLSLLVKWCSHSEKLCSNCFWNLIVVFYLGLHNEWHYLRCLSFSSLQVRKPENIHVDPASLVWGSTLLSSPLLYPL